MPIEGMASSPPQIRRSVYSSSSSAPVSIPSSGIVAEPENNLSRQRAPRSLPPWIDSYEPAYGPAPRDQVNLLFPPSRTHDAQHNSTPSAPQRRVSKDGFINVEDPSLGPAQDSRAKIPHFLRYGRASMRGRRWDHLRSAEPVIVAGYMPTTMRPSNGWQGYIHSSAYGPLPNEDSEVLDFDNWEKLQPNFGMPAQSPYDSRAIKASRHKRGLAHYSGVWNIIMRHSLSPLLFRLAVMVTSIIALGIAGRIYHVEDSVDPESAERTQSIVAIVVDCVAVPYIGYMIWDEYTGKPLGLRSGVSKISLILLDLFFIIFKSASTALAFESLVYHNAKENTLRSLAKALATFMLVGLIAWTMNFTVNIFRTVERLGGGEEERGK
ncbi:hypothetical protein N3K66_007998 [Trichothecium roseum]|uniref:Uncharacterized protein n=1 Tax=Trichothecium roseum TaxID=47278 RepID=A0ACC0USB2_9HYPO|nr:hypothetical protein N3K66_007998 [Trichothecium roseum]